MTVRRSLLASTGLALLALWSPALAQSSPGVVMAAYGGGNGDTWREMIAKPFTQATSIPAQVSDLANTETPIRASRGNPQYNVGWVGYYAAATLYKEGLLETFDTAEFPGLRDVPERFLLKAGDGRVIGFPVQFQYYGIAFNTQQAKASDFPSWTSLGDAKWKGRLAQAQPFIGASYDLPMFSHIAGGTERNLDPGLPGFRAFSRNATTVMTSFAQGNTLLSRGEVAAAPFYSARVRALKRDGAPVDIMIPGEGALMLPYMLVVPKGAKNREALVAFLNYALQPGPQIRMFDYSGYIPMNAAAKLDDKQAADLGMPLPELLKRLYVTDFWAQADTLKPATELVETIQAAR